jgi:hyaluronan synthase
MFTFLTDTHDALRGHPLTPYLVFFAYVWGLWVAKAVAARRYRPTATDPGPLATTVIVPVYREDEAVFRRVLASVAANEPTEIISVIDGGDERLALIAEAYCDRVLRIPKAGKRAAIAAGLAASEVPSEVVIVLDSDTEWEPDTLGELLRPFADPSVGGATPRQAISDPRANAVRRLAEWMEDVRYHLTVPAQSLFGQVGCLAGRTIAYRRAAFEPAVRRLVRQRVLGIPQHVGDDRVLTNELLRSGWRTVYQSTALVRTEAPDDWRTFWRQQLRWGRSSQRETLLSLRWLWRRPVAFLCFATDILTPFALYTVLAVAVAHALRGTGGPTGWPLPIELPLGYAGMLVSIGLRQMSHLRRAPQDIARLPVFVLQLTFVMVPIRILAFATMLHQGWSTRAPAPDTRGSHPQLAAHEVAVAESAH